MTTIDDLGKPLSEMTMEELLALNKKNRAARSVTPPERVKTARKKRKVNFLNTIANMSDEQKAELLKTLGG